MRARCDLEDNTDDLEWKYHITALEFTAMTLDNIRKCIWLGNAFKDKLLLGLFGFIAPQRDLARNGWWRLLSIAIPNFWLRPKQLNGAGLLIDPTDWSQTLIFEEVFLRSGYDLEKVDFIPDVIIDCGAHIGIFSLLARSKFPHARLIAYEPNPENIRFIQEQVLKNGFALELNSSAISTETKELFFSASNSHSGRLLHGESPENSFRVQAINFPLVFDRIKPASLLLKMDIEGEERNVLPLLVPMLPRQAALFFETHAGEVGWREVESLLARSGFRVEQLNARGQFFDGFAHRS